MKFFQNINEHPIVAAFVGLLAAALLIFAFYEGKILQAAVYLAAMLLAVLTTDFLAARLKADDANFPIKSPVKELKLLLFVQAFVIVLSLLRFQVFTDWQNTSIVFKLPLLLLMLIFGFPIFLVIVFLKWKYSFRDLGFRLRGIWLGLPVILILGAAAYFLASEKAQFGAAFRDMGLIQIILVGFLGAAIPEEFARFLMQTRICKFFENYAVGWLVASGVWAFIHLPGFYSQNTQGLLSALGSVLSILPIGLLWGFMTHRTGSILPAVTVHGTNLWGLQNY